METDSTRADVSSDETSSEIAIDDNISKKIIQILELESVEEKDKIVADILKNGRQVLVKYKDILIPEVYSTEITKSNEETVLLTLIKEHVYKRLEMKCKDQAIVWVFINKIKAENNEHFERVLRHIAEYGSTYTKSSSILTVVLQLLFQGIDDDSLKNKTVFTDLLNSVKSKGLKACRTFADYIAEDDLKEQLDDSDSPLFQAIKMYYQQAVPIVLQEYNISNTRDLYQLAIDNISKNGWVDGIDLVKGKIPPIKYKELLEHITSKYGATAKPEKQQTPTPTPNSSKPASSKASVPDGIHTEKNKEDKKEQSSPFVPRAGFTAVQNACQIEALNLHNSLRAKHGSPALVLDDAISRKAQAYAEYLANTGQFQHSTNRDGLGENLYAEWGSTTCQNTGYGVKATQSWYDEIKYYSYNRPGFSMSTGHFTQVVWKSSNKLGVGIAFGDGGRKVLIVAQYGPGGNMMGDFPRNVVPPR